MSLVRAKASATREVSTVIHRLPHCSATYAVVPLPHVGSKTKSPGSVVMRMQRWIVFIDVCTTYSFSWLPITVSVHILFIGFTGKSLSNLRYLIDFSEIKSLPLLKRFFTPSTVVFQC